MGPRERRGLGTTVSQILLTVFMQRNTYAVNNPTEINVHPCRITFCPA